MLLYRHKLPLWLFIGTDQLRNCSSIVSTLLRHFFCVNQQWCDVFIYKSLCRVSSLIYHVSYNGLSNVVDTPNLK